MTPPYAVLFKCHDWDDFVDRQLERLKRVVGDGDIFVCVDETRGGVRGITHPEDRVFRLTEQTTCELGLEHNEPTPTFWYSNDYPLHAFTRRYPDYAFYVAVEFDVVVTIPLDDVIRHLQIETVDLLAEPIGTPLRQWTWYPSCEGWYTDAQIVHWLTCLSVFSNRAAHLLYERRIEAGQRLRAGERSRLPMCEAVIPTELYLAGMKLLALHQIGSTTFYNDSPPFSEDVVDLSAIAGFIHPLLSVARFVPSMLRFVDAAALLDDEHPYRKRFSAAAFALALPRIHDRLRLRLDQVGCRRAVALMRQSDDADYLALHGLDGRNLALGKPASQSSLSAWSTHPEEANDAVSGPLCGSFTFQTDIEERPWWMVDLLKREPVGLVRVFNRMDIPWRANGLEVWVSEDGRHWELAGRHSADTAFGGIDGRPLEVAVNREIRFVRLEIPRQDILHLDQVQVLRRIE